MMGVVVVACQEFSLKIYEGEAESTRLRSVPSSRETSLHISAVGPRYEQMAKLVYLGGAVSADAKFFININRCVSLA